MTTRRALVAGFGAAAVTGGAATCLAQGMPWKVPSDERVRELLADRIDRQKRGVGMVVGIAEGRTRRVIAYGSSGTDRKLDGDTIFQIGSVSKMFVTLLLADAAVRREIRLEDPASAYLPQGVRMPSSSRPVALEHLATHMSGLPSMPTNFQLKAFPNPVEAYTSGDLHRFLSAYTLPREPGAGFEYSNLGVALLGRLLATRARRPYEALLKQRVLAPLGLGSTGITVDRAHRARLARGHDMYGRPVETWEMRTLQASGSLRSTGNDLLKFIGAYLAPAGTPLAAAIDFQTRQPSPANSPRRQSLGIPMSINAAGQAVLFHDGGKEGFRSFVAINPTAETGIVVLSNCRSDDSLESLTLHLIGGRAIRDRAPTPPPGLRTQVVLPPALLASYEGRYRFPSGDVLAVACNRERMLLDRLGDGISVFYSEAPGRFYSRVEPAEVVFQRSGEAAESLTLRQAGRESVAQRSST